MFVALILRGSSQSYPKPWFSIFSPRSSTNSRQSLSNTNDIFHRTETNNSEICIETQKIPNSQKNPNKEKQSWRNQAPLLQTTTKLQSLMYIFINSHPYPQPHTVTHTQPHPTVTHTHKVTHTPHSYTHTHVSHTPQLHIHNRTHSPNATKHTIAYMCAQSQTVTPPQSHLQSLSLTHTHTHTHTLHTCNYI